MHQQAIDLGKNPLYLMLPVAVTTSFSFMFPVSSPPNAIAFATGRLRVVDMVQSLHTRCFYLGPSVYGVG